MNVASTQEGAIDEGKKAEAWERKSPTGEWPPPPDRYERALLDLFEGFKPGRLLDVPCGQGAMSLRLRDMGYKVSCFDIAPELLRAEGFTVETGDMNESLPYPDREFDYILCKNGAHRVFGLDRLVSEFARITKTGGIAVISVPNYGRMERRLRFFLRGSVSRNINSQECEGVLDSPAANFRNGLLYPQIEISLRRHGFEVERVTSDGRAYRRLHLLPFVLLARFFCLFDTAKDRLDFCTKRVNSAHAIAGGGHIIVVARRL